MWLMRASLDVRPNRAYKITLLCQPEAATYKIATGRPVALGSVRKRRQIQPLDCKLEGVVSVGVHKPSVTKRQKWWETGTYLE